MRFLTELWQRIGTERAMRSGRQQVHRSPSRPAPRFRPRLEALEDRCVPSTLAVTSPLDDVNIHGTLRYDIAHAASGDTIKITPALQGALIVLTQGELLLDKNVTIEGQANHPVTISGNNNSRVFEVASGAHVTLRNLTITGGNGVANPSDISGYGGEGGGVLNFGTLTIENSTLTGNSAQRFGGAIFSNGEALTVSNSILTNNSASGGGGIANYFGTLTVSNSTLSGNSAFYGGGIFSNGGTATVSNSTLSSNSATAGGGIFDESGTLTISYSTLSSNSASSLGGGIENMGGTATVSNSTLSDNSAGTDGGGIYNYFGTLTVNSSSFCDNTPDAIGGEYTDEGGNTFC